MDALDNMRKRLQFNGGEKQQSRMIEDKLKSLKKALLYSYQAGTMIVDNPYKDIEQDTLEFRCLMNPDKISFEADKKMLSVPFEDICLNLPREGRTYEHFIKVPIAVGETFIWKETSSRWIVTLKYLEELAYFRADVRKCFDFPIEIEDKKYWFSSIGENQSSLEWLKKNREEWNKLNYTRTLYIKRDETTLDYFKRFKIVQIPNIKGELEPWEVQAVNPNSIDDILIVHVKEYFKNQFEDISKEEQERIQEQHEIDEDYIVYVYDKIIVEQKYILDGLWEIKNATSGLKFDIDATIAQEKETSICAIQLLTGKTGSFDIYYGNNFVKHVVVKSI